MVLSLACNSVSPTRLVWVTGDLVFIIIIILRMDLPVSHTLGSNSFHNIPLFHCSITLVFCYHAISLCIEGHPPFLNYYLIT
jgi:hypothetical protein